MCCEKNPLKYNHVMSVLYNSLIVQAIVCNELNITHMYILKKIPQ